MQSADEPAESDVMVQGLQTAPGFSSRGNINQREQNSRYNLQHEHRQCGAAKHIPPTGGISRYPMFDHFANGRGQLQAVVKPGSNLY